MIPLFKSFDLMDHLNLNANLISFLGLGAMLARFTRKYNLLAAKLKEFFTAPQLNHAVA